MLLNQYVVKLALGVAALSLCTACGGSASYPTFASKSAGNGNPTFEQIEPAIDFAINRSERIRGVDGDPNRNGYFPTKFDAIPTNGNATFHGAGGVNLFYTQSTEQDYLAVIGDAEINIDFASAEFDGAVTSMVAYDDERNVFQVTGTYNYSGGALGVGLPNQFVFDYDVNLAAAGIPIVVDGEMVGQFFGTRPVGSDQLPHRIKALFAFDETPNVTAGDNAVIVAPYVHAEAPVIPN